LAATFKRVNLFRFHSFEKSVIDMPVIQVNQCAFSPETGEANYKAYLTEMRQDKTVQFVCFETILDTERFITQWEHFIRSANSDVDVTLQQSEKNGVFKYIAQHRYAAGEFQFVFTKATRSSRIPEVEIKAKQAGGYSILQLERPTDTHANESKVFAFIINPQTDLSVYKQLSSLGKLNIYEAYYENCQYAYILEFFVKNKNVAELMEQLKLQEVTEARVYKECVLQAS
jgi:hypothetical protein